MNRKRFHNSASRFSIGVPVQITRKSAFSVMADDDRLVAAFLIAWASSRTMVAKCTFFSASASCWRIV